MSTQRILHHHPLPAGTPVIEFDHGRPGSVTPESPASDVMTDLRHTPAFTTEPDADRVDANRNGDTHLTGGEIHR